MGQGDAPGVWTTLRRPAWLWTQPFAARIIRWNWRGEQAAIATSPWQTKEETASGRKPRLSNPRIDFLEMAVWPRDAWAGIDAVEIGCGFRVCGGIRAMAHGAKIA
jgi:hypothetical protein